MTAETAEVAVEEEVKKPDLEVILGVPGELTIAGIDCYVKRIKTREFFELMGVITTGMGGNIAQLGFDTDNQQEFGAQLVAALFVSLPNAVDPFLRLVRNIVKPQDDQDARELREILENPELEDMMAIADCVIAQEQDSLWELVGKARAYAGRWKTTVSQSKGRGRERST